MLLPEEGNLLQIGWLSESSGLKEIISRVIPLKSWTEMLTPIRRLGEYAHISWKRMRKSHYSLDWGTDTAMHYIFLFPLQGTLSYLKIFRPLLREGCLLWFFPLLLISCFRFKELLHSSLMRVYQGFMLICIFPKWSFCSFVWRQNWQTQPLSR